jgi:hypothetical protein
LTDEKDSFAGKTSTIVTIYTCTVLYSELLPVKNTDKTAYYSNRGPLCPKFATNLKNLLKSSVEPGADQFKAILVQLMHA